MRHFTPNMMGVLWHAPVASIAPTGTSCPEGCAIEYRVMGKWIRILRWRKLHVPQENGQRNRDHHETGLMIFMKWGACRLC